MNLVIGEIKSEIQQDLSDQFSVDTEYKKVLNNYQSNRGIKFKSTEEMLNDKVFINMVSDMENSRLSNINMTIADIDWQNAETYKTQLKLNNALKDRTKKLQNLETTNNLTFNFEQNVNGKTENGHCALSYPQKIFCKYNLKNKKLFIEVEKQKYPVNLELKPLKDKNVFYWSEGSISVGKVGDTNVSTSKEINANSLTIGVDKFTEDFFTPVQGWPGMNEFLQHFFNNDVPREEYINEIEALQNISNAMELSLQKNQWINL